MGNLTSQTGHVTRSRPSTVEHELPALFRKNAISTSHRQKVLPHRDFYQKLLPTNNGKILYSGGTLTGRYRQNRYRYRNNSNDMKIFNDASTLTIDESISNRVGDCYLSTHSNPCNKNNYRRMGDHEYKKYTNMQSLKKQVKQFGSEPDLRNPCSLIERKELSEKCRIRTMYTIPVSTNKITPEQEKSQNVSTSQTKKARLYKTKAEMKKRKSSLLNVDNKIQSKQLLSIPRYSIKLNNTQYLTNDIEDESKTQETKMSSIKLIQMRRACSMPEFRPKLREAGERLKISNIADHNHMSDNTIREKLSILKNRFIEKEEVKQNTEEIMQEDCRTEGINNIKGSSQFVIRPKKQQQTKMFYFGMNSQMDPIEIDNKQINSNDTPYFTSALQSYSCNASVKSSCESDLSSEIELDECTVKKSSIALRLRPILPRKQLKVPRFSPTVAWHMLSSVNSNYTKSTMESDDGPFFMEDRIEKQSRLMPPPVVQGSPRLFNDKSGDSGISGDAEPIMFKNSSDAVILDQRVDLQVPLDASKVKEVSWTPQQDLGDDSSTEENVCPTIHKHQSNTALIPAGSHIFCLSIPKEHHSDTYVDDKFSFKSYTSLEKINKSMSQTFDCLPDKKDAVQGSAIYPQNNNWFLSRSEPNSINSVHNLIEAIHPQNPDPQEFLAWTSATKTPSTRRLVYLPELTNIRQNKSIHDLDTLKSENMEKENLQRYKVKSHESILFEMKGSSERGDPSNVFKTEKCATTKPKKFTFQSTMRQIEKRKFAERLSKEAERKEIARLRELEVMQHVEEEFRRKRAGEKASIRQQLRLFSMENSGWSSLPLDLEAKEDYCLVRSEPDGAVSSPASSPMLSTINKKDLNDLNKHISNASSSDEHHVKAHATQILSEYKQPQREYKDYRGSIRYLITDDYEPVVPQTTIHPQVTCNIPKATRL